MYKTKVLSNNLKVVYEKIPHARSVSAGVWVLSGSRYERISGMSHFIEHMLFKGTKTKTARQIAEKTDRCGGQLNAYTTREYTAFYSLTPADSLDDSLELLSDMINNSVFSKKDIELEKNVVLEEISMYEDSPEDLVFDLLEEHAFFGNTLGRSITGTKESVNSITREEIKEHMESFYTPGNMILAVAGSFDEDRLIETAEKYFGSAKERPVGTVTIKKPEFFTGTDTVIKDIEQANVVVGFESFGYDNEERYPLIILNNALGGGMSSRLFQKIREESGLAYSVYTSVSNYRDTGIFAVYAGLAEKNLDSTLKIIESELNKVAKEGLTIDETERAKEQVAGSLILSGESVSSHMSALGRGMLLSGEVKDEDFLLSKIRTVTAEDVKRTAQMLFSGQKSFTQIVRGNRESSQRKSI